MNNVNKSNLHTKVKSGSNVKNVENIPSNETESEMNVLFVYVRKVISIRNKAWDTVFHILPLKQ